MSFWGGSLGFGLPVCLEGQKAVDFFVSNLYFFWEMVILIMTGCFNSVMVRVLTCSQKIFLWEMKYFSDLCACRNPLPVYINSPLKFFHW